MGIVKYSVAPVSVIDQDEEMPAWVVKSNEEKETELGEEEESDKPED